MVFDLNYLPLALFALLLVLLGIVSFVIPAPKSPTSGAAPYNIFPACGIIGTGIVLERPPQFKYRLRPAWPILGRASLQESVSQAVLQMDAADDILHIVVGTALVVIGILGS